MKIATVTGAVQADQLGKTLMHEHLIAGLSGWELDNQAPRHKRADIIKLCVDRVQELQAAGYKTLIDPCPNDLGRDVGIMGEVGARTGFNIICSTGFYNQEMGGNAYWQVRSTWDKDFVDRVADVMIRELTDGAGDEGIKPGIIKLASSHLPMTDYEKKLFAAGAKAAVATNTPITTHTEAILGDQQLDYLTSHGVPANRIVIGHCCGSSDHHYHMDLIGKGAYIGFDRFGIESIRPDEGRAESLLQIIRAGGTKGVVISHDSVWCMRGEMIPANMAAAMSEAPLRFERQIVPKLLAAGAAKQDIDAMLVDNPRRYFAGEARPA
jgi:phosphotriesterase-related protein